MYNYYTQYVYCIIGKSPREFCFKLFRSGRDTDLLLCNVLHSLSRLTRLFGGERYFQLSVIFFKCCFLCATVLKNFETSVNLHLYHYYNALSKLSHMDSPVFPLW